MQEAALWLPCSASAPSPAQDTLSVTHMVSLQSPGRRSLSLQTLLTWMKTSVIPTWLQRTDWFAVAKRWNYCDRT